MDAARQRWLRLAREAPLGASSSVASGVVTVALAAWLAAAGWGPAELGLIGLVGLPWTLKPLWAPVLDRVGVRGRWLVGAQVAVIVALGALALVWTAAPRAILWVAVGLAFAGATLDLAVDGWRVEAHPARDREAATGVFVLGYRAGFLASGALAIPIAASASAPVALLVGAGLVACGLLAFRSAPPLPARAPVSGTLLDAWRLPVRTLASAPGAGITLALVALFKLGELPMLTLAPAFLVIRGVAPGTVALAQGVAMAAAVVGALGAAGLASRLGATRALLVAGGLQAATNLGYAALAIVPATPLAVGLATALDGLAGGLGAACFVSFLMGRCDPGWSSAHYALLSALSGLAGRLATAPLGAIAGRAGWATCFVVATLAAAPGLGLLVMTRRIGATSRTR